MTISPIRRPRDLCGQLVSENWYVFFDLMPGATSPRHTSLSTLYKINYSPRVKKCKNVFTYTSPLYQSLQAKYHPVGDVGGIHNISATQLLNI